MYRGRRIKLAVLVGATAGAVILLFVNRTKAVISDVTFMQSMIPHHSIAVNNARKASITDRASADSRTGLSNRRSGRVSR